MSLFLFFLLGPERFPTFISINLLHLLIIVFAPILGLFFLIQYSLPFTLNTLCEYLLVIFIAIPFVFLDKFIAFLGWKLKQIFIKN